MKTGITTLSVNGRRTCPRWSGFARLISSWRQTPAATDGSCFIIQLADLLDQYRARLLKLALIHLLEVRTTICKSSQDGSYHSLATHKLLLSMIVSNERTSRLMKELIVGPYN